MVCIFSVITQPQGESRQRKEFFWSDCTVLYGQQLCAFKFVFYSVCDDEKMSEEQNSLDYIEDPYFNPPDNTLTPSLDDELENIEYLDDYDILENELELFDLRQLDFDDVNYFSNNSLPNDESVNVEMEFFNVKRANAIIRAFFKKDFKKQVRVTYCDLTKPYLAKLPKDSNFRKYLDIGTDGESFFFFKKTFLITLKLFFFVVVCNIEEATAIGDHLPEDISNLSIEEQEKQQKAWKEELAQIEDEISTLRTVLASKMRRSAELKRNLGITVWKELSDDVNQGLKNVKESNV